MLFMGKTALDIIRLCNQPEKLSRIEMLILDFIYAINPFCDRHLRLNTSDLADDLKISRSAISKAIARLRKLRYIEIKRARKTDSPDVTTLKVSGWMFLKIKEHGMTPEEIEADYLAEQRRIEEKYLYGIKKDPVLPKTMPRTLAEVAELETIELIDEEKNQALISLCQESQALLPKVVRENSETAPKIAPGVVRENSSPCGENSEVVRENSEACAKNRQGMRENSEAQIAETQSEQSFQPNQNSLDYKTKKTPIECVDRSKKHKLGTASPSEPEVATLPVNQQEILQRTGSLSGSTGQQQNLGEDKFSAASAKKLAAPSPSDYRLPSAIAQAAIMPTQKMQSECSRSERPIIRRPKFLYPDGEWLDSQGRMNVDFIRWMSSRWKVKFPDNAERPTEEIMADVLAYFANQPEKVAIQWDAYCAMQARKVENITQRALTGFTMSSVDAREYAIAASAIPSSQADAATDFTPQSVCDRSAEVQRVLSAPAHPAQVLQIAPGQRQKTLSAPAPIPDPWQVVGEPCRTEEQEGNWSEIVTAKRQEWENSRPPGAVNFSDAISGIPAEPTPFTREGFAIVDGQISAVSNQGAYKIMFDYQTPVQEIKTPPQDIADITPEQQAINCQKIAEMIKNLANKKSGKFAGKNWAEKLSTEATKPQYQVNKDGYFIDEEGEW